MPSELGADHIAKLKERLHNLRYRNLQSVLQNKENEFQIDMRRISEKLQVTLESIRDSDQKIFDGAPFFGNLLTLLYLNNDDDEEEAVELNNQVLTHFPEDKTALQNKVEILLHNDDLEEAEQVILVLEGDQNSKYHFYSSVVDVAYLYHNFPPKFYGTSVTLFRQALNGVKQIKSESETNDGTDLDMMYEMEGISLIWRYYLIVTYNRLINSGNIMAQNDDLIREELTPAICFENMNELAIEMITSPLISYNQIYIAKTLIELYDAHHKMKFPTVKGSCECCLCVSLNEDKYKTVLIFLNTQSESAGADAIPIQTPADIDSLLRNALRLAPDDGHVLEKCGRFERTKARTMGDFQEAERTLRKCVDLYPERHVAWHQLGLVYRSMWHPDNSQMFNNSARSGKKKKKKKKNKGCDDIFGGDWAAEIEKITQKIADKTEVQRDVSFNEAEYHVQNSETQHDMLFKQTDQSENTKTKHDMSFKQTENQSEKTETKQEISVQPKQQKEFHPEDPSLPHIPFCQSDCKEQQNIKHETSPNKNIRGVDKEPDVTTVQPKYKTKFGSLPKHHNRCDYFDGLRTSNPQYEGREVPNLLRQAFECFHKASTLVKETQCRLLIDLGRCYYSMRKVKESEKCLKKAKRCKGAIDHDLAYVFEQWGLILHEENVNKNFADEKKYDKMKSLYRRSVEYAVKAKVRSKIAFNNLKDILEEETLRKPDDLCAKKEYALLQKVVENFTRAEHMIHTILSAEGWKKDPKLKHLGWDLVEIFAETGQYRNAWSYLEMNLLLSAEKAHDLLILKVGINAARDEAASLLKESSTDLDVQQNLGESQKDFYDLEAEAIYGQMCESSQKIYAKTFTTLIKLHQFPNRSVSMVNVTNQEKEQEFPRSLSADNTLIQPHDVLLVLDSDNYQPPGYPEIKSLLHHCGLIVKDDSDILPGYRLAPSGLEELAEQSTSVLIFTDQIDTDMELLNRTAWNIVSVVQEWKTLQPIACLQYNQHEKSKLNRLPTVYTKDFVDKIRESGCLNMQSVENSNVEALQANKDETMKGIDAVKHEMIYELFKSLCIDSFDHDKKTMKV